MNKFLRLFIGAVLGLFALLAAAQTPRKPVQLIGTGMHDGGKVVYRYVVKNNGTEAVKRILLGFSNETPDLPNTLKVFPFSPAMKTSADWFAPPFATAPLGWGARLIAAGDGSGQFGIDWIEGNFYQNLWPNAVPRAFAPQVFTPAKSLLPGQTLEGFAVTLSEADLSYLTTTAIVTYGDHDIDVVVEKGDTLPPVMNLSVRRLHQNGSLGHWAIFDITATVSDNLDPAPALSFAPITANQAFNATSYTVERTGHGWKIKLLNVAGRIYDMRFIAADASGNQTVKSYRYEVSTGRK